MRSVRLRQFKEALNGKLVSRDTNFDASLDLAFQFEENLKILLAKVDQLQVSLQGVSSFTSDLVPIALSMLNSSELHCGILAKAKDVQGTIGSLFADSV